MAQILTLRQCSNSAELHSSSWELDGYAVHPAAVVQQIRQLLGSAVQQTAQHVRQHSSATRSTVHHAAHHAAQCSRQRRVAGSAQCSRQRSAHTLAVQLTWAHSIPTFFPLECDSGAPGNRSPVSHPALLEDPATLACSHSTHSHVLPNSTQTHVLPQHASTNSCSQPHTAISCTAIHKSGAALTVTSGSAALSAIAGAFDNSRSRARLREVGWGGVCLRAPPGLEHIQQRAELPAAHRSHRQTSPSGSSAQ